MLVEYNLNGIKVRKHKRNFAKECRTNNKPRYSSVVMFKVRYTIRPRECIN